MGIGWDVIFLWFGVSLARFGVIPVVIFRVFLSFGGCLGHPGASLGPKGGSWTPLGDQTRIKVILRVPGGRHFVAKGGPRDPQRRR